MDLNVLLVEDEPRDMQAYLRDFPAVFEAAGITAQFHTAATFERAYELIEPSHVRYDLILSDTFRGQQKNRDAAVISMVKKYREGRFCPLVVFSASARPADLEVGAFVVWADKSVSGEIESAIQHVLATGIPQLARSLHDELDRTAGGFLWNFLETHWGELWPDGNADIEVLGRLVRRRAALQLAEFDDSTASPVPLTSIAGLEYYIYPPLHKKAFKLGQVIMKTDQPADVRVILTPHCHLTIQADQKEPRAEYVLTVKVIPACEFLCAEKRANARAAEKATQDKKLKSWSTPPSGSDVGKPQGRYWYLPGFLKISHSYCDFQQVETIRYSALEKQYESIAVLTPPFAESLQACFVGFHAAVGIPVIKSETIRSLLN